MVSKLVTDRQKSAEQVLAVADSHAVRIATAVGELSASPAQREQALMAATTLLQTLSHALGAARDRMVAADLANDAELADDAPAREARDETTATLREELVALREILVGTFGGPFAARIMAASTPEDPVVLARFAREVAARFRDTPAPASRIPGATINGPETAKRLEELAATLESALTTVAREGREAQASLQAKLDATRAYDLAFAGTATVLSGLLQLAGEGGLAARVRPSRRRAGRAEEDSVEEPESPPTTDGN